MTLLSKFDRESEDAAPSAKHYFQILDLERMKGIK